MAKSTNLYSFDFLKTEHQQDGGDAPPRPALSSLDSASTRSLAWGTPDFEDVRSKTEQEKIFIVTTFLKAHRASGHLSPSIIYRSTGVDLAEHDYNVAKALRGKENVHIEKVPDPENPSLMISTYCYQSKFTSVRDRKSLMAEINSTPNGISMNDLADCYEGARQDLLGLITAGDVIACDKKEAKDKILFPRGESFLVELDGTVTMKQNGSAAAPVVQAVGSMPMTDDQVVAAAIQRSRMNNQNQPCVMVDTDVDPTSQIRRGEAVSVGDQWFRVSSAVQGGPLSEQPVRAQAPLSVVSIKGLDSKNEVDGYIRPFNRKMLPLDAPLAPYARDNLQNAKTARDQLHKLAGIRGLSGGVAAQLLSPLVSSMNPSTLANSFATGSGAAASRKRPASSMKSSNNVQSAQARKDAEAAQKAATDPCLALYTHARRHGCTTDVRKMYLDTKELIPQDEDDLHKMLLEHNLIEPGEAKRRPRLAKKPNVDNDGKTKKKRYYQRKNQRITNTHLVGTDIGAVLAAAQEKQQQGKTVGDGGM